MGKSKFGVWGEALLGSLGLLSACGGRATGVSDRTSQPTKPGTQSRRSLSCSGLLRGPRLAPVVLATVEKGLGSLEPGESNPAADGARHGLLPDGRRSELKREALEGVERAA